MIRSLQILNYAIIEELEIRFSEGMTIVTGETGAGKSILVGALGLIMGNRADTKVLYIEDQKCMVEALFDIRKYGLRSFFEENDLDYEDELLIRREITPSGKSRAFVNDTPVNLKILQELSSSLVDLHQQFDSLDIHNVSFQLRMIDALADNKPHLEKYQLLYRRYQTDRRQLAELIERNENSARESDFINFQLEEFNKAELIGGELEQLEEELARLTNAEEIKKTLGAAFRRLSESEHSVISQLEELGAGLYNLRKVYSGLNDLYERFQGLTAELQELSGEFEKIAEDTEYDPERIMEVQQRLDLIYRLQKKHGAATVEELLEIQQNMQRKLEAFNDLSAEIDHLQTQVKQEEKELVQMALELRARRMSVVESFEAKVLSMLALVAMEHAQLKVEFTALEELSPTGLDELHFLFAANRGSRLQDIKDVASGGELARLTLVIKSLVAGAIPLPTLIFDEIDTGISGDVALKMGGILRKLSNQHQVVTITHSPQVASKADAHYFVYKEVRDDRTVTKVRKLNQEERVRAIATMLSQSPPTESAIENAKELLSIS